MGALGVERREISSTGEGRICVCRDWYSEQSITNFAHCDKHNGSATRQIERDT